MIPQSAGGFQLLARVQFLPDSGVVGGLAASREVSDAREDLTVLRH